MVRQATQVTGQCSSCGTENAENSRFCNGCGSPIANRFTGKTSYWECWRDSTTTIITITTIISRTGKAAQPIWIAVARPVGAPCPFATARG